jgi:hypothetical protein
MRKIRAAGRPRRTALVAALFAMLVAVAPVGAAAGWRGPTQIGAVAGCTDVSVALDADGGRHVAASCGGSVRYLTDREGAWVTTTFSHPAGRADLAPTVVVDGDTVHVAYTRFPSGTGTFAPVGVYHRERALDGDTWSTAARLGSSGDLLGDFAVVGGLVHATVAALRGGFFYETDRSGALARHALPGAISPGTLNVASDGAARFAFDTATSLRYAIFHGSGFDWFTIPRTNAASEQPQLAVDADGRAHVAWTQPATATGGAASAVGVQYSTNSSGEWTGLGSGRVTANVGSSVLAIDLETGRPHVVVATSAGVKYYTPASATAWGGVTINPRVAGGLDLAIDPATAQLVVLSSRLTSGLPATLFLMTKP